MIYSEWLTFSLIVNIKSLYLIVTIKWQRHIQIYDREFLKGYDTEIPLLDYVVGAMHDFTCAQCLCFHRMLDISLHLRIVSMFLFTSSNEYSCANRVRVFPNLVYHAFHTRNTIAPICEVTKIHFLECWRKNDPFIHSRRVSMIDQTRLSSIILYFILAWIWGCFHLLPPSSCTRI